MSNRSGTFARNLRDPGNEIDIKGFDELPGNLYRNLYACLRLLRNSGETGEDTNDLLYMYRRPSRKYKLGPGPIICRACCKVKMQESLLKKL